MSSAESPSTLVDDLENEPGLSAEDQQLTELFEQFLLADDAVAAAKANEEDVTRVANARIADAQQITVGAGDVAAKKATELAAALKVRAQRSPVAQIAKLFASLGAAAVLLVSLGCKPEPTSCECRDAVGEFVVGRLDVLIAENRATLEELQGLRSDVRRFAVASLFARPRRDVEVIRIGEQVDRLVARVCVERKAEEINPPLKPVAPPPKPRPDPRRPCRSLSSRDVDLEGLATNCPANERLRRLWHWRPVRNVLQNGLRLFIDPSRNRPQGPGAAGAMAIEPVAEIA